jgi:hypothetical protein
LPPARLSYCTLSLRFYVLENRLQREYAQVGYWKQNGEARQDCSRLRGASLAYSSVVAVDALAALAASVSRGALLRFVFG